MSQPYWQLLQDPRWQRVRLEIMEQAEFRCERCDAADKSLHVHHTYYEKNLDPWDYPRESLRCYCQPCHEEANSLYRDIKRGLGGLHGWDTDRVLGYITGLQSRNVTSGEITGNYPFGDGVANAWGLDLTNIWEAAQITKTGQEELFTISIEQLTKLEIDALRARWEGHTNA